jgi:hypothetical protein
MNKDAEKTDLTDEECIEKADELYYYTTGGSVLAVDNSLEKVYKFKTDGEKFEVDGEMVDVISLAYENRKNYETSSKFEKIDPPTMSNLRTELTVLNI